MTDAIKKAKLFVQKLGKEGFDIEKAYLFGSYASGNADKDSDIDICVVSQNFGKDYIGEMVQLRKISLQIDSRIEPIPFGRDDINDPYSAIASEVRKNGVNI
jgi:predicted nucleotidyltransferase